MDNIWEKELLEASKRRGTKREAAKFAGLLDQIDEEIDKRTASALMKTFSSEPDYGTQEEVIGILQETPADVRASAILDELPRLVRDAREWAYELVGDELKHNSKTFLKTANEKPRNVKEALQALHEDDDFADRCRNAGLLASLFRS